MAGNAHARRARKGGRHIECQFCKIRPSQARAEGLRLKNKNGHRHNPAAGKKQKR